MKILIIDDDPDLRLILSVLLQQGGYTTLEAESGAQGLLIAEQDIPDVILLDFVMPEMDGPQVLQQLQAHILLQKIPIIFCTGKNAATREACMRLGARGTLAKPFNPHTFLVEFNALLSL